MFNATVELCAFSPGCRPSRRCPQRLRETSLSRGQEFGIKGLSEVSPMSDVQKDSTSPQPPANNSPTDDAISKQLEKVADEMADKAREREIRYDRDHNIFTK
jgi:hypothetical protein